MTSMLQTLASLEPDDRAVVEFWMRLKVGPADRQAAQELIPMLDAADTANRTANSVIFELMTELADAVLTTDDVGADAFQFGIDVALDKLFWFNLLLGMQDVPQPEMPDIASVWVLRPTEEQPGIRVDRCISTSGPDEWAIRSGENNVLLKTGQWTFEPSPSRRTDEFYEQARFPTMLAAITFVERILSQVLEDPGL